MSLVYVYLERLGLIGMQPGLTLEPRQRHQAVDIDAVLVHVPKTSRRWESERIQGTSSGDGEKEIYTNQSSSLRGDQMHARMYVQRNPEEGGQEGPG